jgi:hypothetical protein
MTTRNIYDLADTWNDGATTFTAIKMNVTDTASASASLLMDLQVGGASRFRASKDGSFGGRDPIFGSFTISASQARISFAPPTSPTMFGMSFAGAFTAVESFRLGSSNPDTATLHLFRDANDTLAQRRGTNAQAFNIYNTYTDASNYERVTFGWNGNVFSISPNAAGTGTTRVIHLSGLPTSNPGPGILWNNSGTPAIGT